MSRIALAASGVTRARPVSPALEEEFIAPRRAPARTRAVCAWTSEEGVGVGRGGKTRAATKAGG